MMDKLRACIQIARPYQYPKNGFVWMPLFFGYKLGDGPALLHTFLAFLAFCLAASSVYIINDLKDVDADREHPVKKLRPLASGSLTVSEALRLAILFLGLSLLVSTLFLDAAFTLLLGSYLLLNLLYSWVFKHVVILDVVCIATGFVIRVFAGGIAAKVWPSHWLVLMTFLLALFLALAKRRDDLVLEAGGHKILGRLDGYNLEFLSYSMVLMAGMTGVSYILYTVSPEVIAKHHTDQLYLTSFWVILGLLRYMQITFVANKSGSPEIVLLRDGFLISVILLWIASLCFMLYVHGNLNG